MLHNFYSKLINFIANVKCFLSKIMTNEESIYVFLVSKKKKIREKLILPYV